MEKIKYRAQVHQENLEGKFVWWEGGRKNKGVFCSYSEMISGFETEDGFINFLAMNFLAMSIFTLVVYMQEGGKLA